MFPAPFLFLLNIMHDLQDLIQLMRIQMQKIPAPQFRFKTEQRTDRRITAESLKRIIQFAHIKHDIVKSKIFQICITVTGPVVNQKDITCLNRAVLAENHMLPLPPVNDHQLRKFMIVKLVFLLRITLDQAQWQTLVRKIFRFEKLSRHLLPSLFPWFDTIIL